MLRVTGDFLGGYDRPWSYVDRQTGEMKSGQTFTVQVGDPNDYERHQISVGEQAAPTVRAALEAVKTGEKVGVKVFVSGGRLWLAQKRTDADEVFVSLESSAVLV